MAGHYSDKEREKARRNMQDNVIRPLTQADFVEHGQSGRDYTFRPIDDSYSTRRESADTGRAKVPANAMKSSGAKQTPSRRERYSETEAYREAAAERRAYAGRRVEEAAVETGAREGFMDRARNVISTIRERDRVKLSITSEVDFQVIIYVVLLCAIGLVMVSSASYYFAYTSLGDPLYYCRKQLLFLLIGFAVLVVARFIPIKVYRRLAGAAYLISTLLCILVLFIGKTVNDSTRWIDLGFVQFQPSEIAKFGVPLFIAAVLEEKQDSVKEWWLYFTLLGLIALPALLIFTENLSNAVILVVICFVIMYVGGIPFGRLALVALLGIIGIGMLTVFPILVEDKGIKIPGILAKFYDKYGYRTLRIRAWLDPWAYQQKEGYQAVQALYAAGSGGIFGRGLGESLQKLGPVPEAHNDIIFAILCEELGLFGGLVVIVLFVLLVLRGIKIAQAAPTKFTCLTALGITTQIGLQAVMNIAVNTNSMPVTGVSLPFISYGGSSLVILLASVGLLLNVSRYQNLPAEPAGKQ